MKKVKRDKEEVLIYNLRTIMQENQQTRLLVLRRLFEISLGRHSLVSIQIFCNDTGMDYHDVIEAARYLAEEGLLTIRDEVPHAVTPPPYLSLTHKGIVEVEQSITNPTKPTEHFPAPVVQHIQNFHASVGAVQTGAQSTAHAIQNLGVEPPEVFRLTADLRRNLDSSPADVRESAGQLVDGLEEEFRLSQPRVVRVRAFLKELNALTDDASAKEILAKVAARYDIEL